LGEILEVFFFSLCSLEVDFLSFIPWSFFRFLPRVFPTPDLVSRSSVIFDVVSSGVEVRRLGGGIVSFALFFPTSFPINQWCDRVALARLSDCAFRFPCSSFFFRLSK